MHLVVDYCGLNAITIQDKYLIPLMTTLMQQVQESTWFTKLDLNSRFNLICLKAGDEWKTAFKTRYDLYEYIVMPFGLTNALSMLKQYVNIVHRGPCLYLHGVGFGNFWSASQMLIEIGGRGRRLQVCLVPPSSSFWDVNT